MDHGFSPGLLASTNREAERPSKVRGEKERKTIRADATILRLLYFFTMRPGLRAVLIFVLCVVLVGVWEVRVL